MLRRTSLYTRHHAHPKAFLVFRGHSLKRRPKITSSPSVISGNFLILLGSEFPLIKRGTFFPTSPLRLLGTPPPTTVCGSIRQNGPHFLPDFLRCVNCIIPAPLSHSYMNLGYENEKRMRNVAKDRPPPNIDASQRRGRRLLMGL